MCATCASPRPVNRVKPSGVPPMRSRALDRENHTITAAGGGVKSFCDAVRMKRRSFYDHRSLPPRLSARAQRRRRTAVGEHCPRTSKASNQNQPARGWSVLPDDPIHLAGSGRCGYRAPGIVRGVIRRPTPLGHCRRHHLLRCAANPNRLKSFLADFMRWEAAGAVRSGSRRRVFGPGDGWRI